MIQTTENWDSLVLSRADFWMVWRFHGIPCFYFYFFLFRSNGKKNTWMRAIFVTVMVIISQVSTESYWMSAVFKVLTTSRHIDNGIWKTTYNWRFCGHGSTYMLILSRVNIMKQKWAKVPWKLLVAQKSELVLWRTLQQGISFIIVYFFFSETNSVFKFNLVLIESFWPHFVYLFTFWYSAYLGVHSLPPRFF